MSRYALLFRGINVGRGHQVKMAELAAMLTALGYTRVQTYIQSGNALLDTAQDEATLARTVRDAFSERFGFACDLAVRSAQQLQNARDKLPFNTQDIAACEAENPGVAHVYVYFLPQPPEPQTVQALQAVDFQGDRLCFVERELYLLCRDSVRTSKAAVAVAKRLPQATARNWNTLCALIELMDESSKSSPAE